MDEKPFLTVREVATLIDASTPRTYGLITAGVIPAVRFGRRVRVPRMAFNEWLRGINDRALAYVKHE